MWTCDKCGSEQVQQEFAFMRPMNDKHQRLGSSFQDDAMRAWQNDYYWCDDCDDACSPIASHINSLHKDYEPS